MCHLPLTATCNHFGEPNAHIFIFLHPILLVQAHILPSVVLPSEFLLVSTVAALGNIASAMAFVLVFFCVEILGAVWEAFAVSRNPVLFLTPTGYGL